MSNISPKSQFLILGVGNPFRHDDGVGPAIIKHLKTLNLSEVDLLDGGTDGLALIDEIAKYQQAIIIDAVNMNAPPGTVRFFNPKEVRINIKHDALSTHGFGIAEVLKLIEELNIPTRIKIIGIQPFDVSFGEGLSNQVDKQMGSVLYLIKKFVGVNF